MVFLQGNGLPFSSAVFASKKAHLAPGLSFLGTDPLHERRGAASLLLQWGLDRCMTENIPAYLESTVDAGPLYGRHGFKAAEDVSMVLEQILENGAPVVYQETCFLYTPSDASDSMQICSHTAER